MTGFLDKLVDLILTAWRWLVPWAIVGDDMCGVVRRFGKFHRCTRPGWNWKIPIVESLITTSSALESWILREQTVTSKDGKSLTLRIAFSYRVIDPRTYILDLGSTDGVMMNLGCVTVAKLAPRFTAEQILHSDEFDRALLERMRLRGKSWGIKVRTCGLVERVQARTYRLITGGERLPE